MSALSQISISANVFLICVGFLSRVEAQRSDSALRYTITEDLAADSLIGNIMQDRQMADSHNSSQYSFRIVPQDGNSIAESMFQVNSLGELRSAVLIDREMVCAQLVSCDVQLNVVIQLAEYFEIQQVQIEILDINDNAPTFEVETISQTISEGAAVGSTLALRAAYDPDSPKFGVQFYQPVSDSISPFKLSYSDTDTDEIYLILQHELDRESEDMLTLRVYASDGGTPPKSASVTVNIEIQDINDNSPAFDKKTFDVDVQEDLGIGEVVTTITADDPDLGDNGAIAYRFSSRTQDYYNEIFQIDRDSGEIVLLASLDYESVSSYTLNVVAENLSPGATSGETLVKINVQDVNDNAPEISIETVIPPVDGLPVVEVNEAVSVGHFVAYFVAADADSEQNGAVTCSLKDSSNSFDLVLMGATDFKIVTTHVLDRESVDHYVLTITCKDQGSVAKSSAQELYVRVIDSNDNPPAFDLAVYHSGLAVNSSIGSLIAHVHATDQDIGQNGDIQYGIARGGDGRVNIDAANGTVNLADTLDDNQKWLNFTVFAIDNGNRQLSGEATVTVQIFDENELVPHFTNTVYAFSVEENAHIGTSVGLVKLLNPIFPNFKPFRFEISKTKNTAFSIEESSGLIRSSSSIDREEKDVYNLQVMAQSITNEHAITSIATVTIRITDQNDQLPYFIFPSKRNNTIYINHDTQPAQTIVTISAKDADSGKNSALSYSIFAGDPLEYFTLGQQTGHLVLAQDLRAVDPQKFSLTIKATDQGSPSLSEETTLNVILRSSSAVNSKLAIYLGVAFGVALMLLILVVVICVVLRKQKRTAKKCKKVEQMLDEKMKSLENMSQNSTNLANLSHGSSEMEAHRAQGLEREDKRHSYCQNPHFGYLGDRDSDSGCSTDLSNTESNKGASNSQYSAMPNGQAYSGPVAGRVPVWNSQIPEDGPYQDNLFAQGIPSRNPKDHVIRSLSASVAEQQSHARQTDKRRSYPIISSSSEHLQLHHNQGYLDDDMAPGRDVSNDSSDSEHVQQQRLPTPVYSRLAKMNNSSQRIQNLADPALYEQMFYNELQQHYHPYGSRYSDDETHRGRLQSDEESNGHRSDTAVMRSHMHQRRGPGTRKRRPSRGGIQKHMPPSRHDLYGPPMLPMTHMIASIVGRHGDRHAEPQINNDLLSRVPSSSGHGTAPSSLSESDVAQSNSTSDSRRTTGVTSSDDEVNLDELGVTQV